MPQQDATTLEITAPEEPPCTRNFVNVLMPSDQHDWTDEPNRMPGMVLEVDAAQEVALVIYRTPGRLLNVRWFSFGELEVTCTLPGSTQLRLSAAAETTAA